MVLVPNPKTNTTEEECRGPYRLPLGVQFGSSRFASMIVLSVRRFQDLLFEA